MEESGPPGVEQLLEGSPARLQWCADQRFKVPSYVPWPGPGIVASLDAAASVGPVPLEAFEDLPPGSRTWAAVSSKEPTGRSQRCSSTDPTSSSPPPPTGPPPATSCPVATSGTSRSGPPRTGRSGVSGRTTACSACRVSRSTPRWSTSVTCRCDRRSLGTTRLRCPPTWSWPSQAKTAPAPSPSRPWSPSPVFRQPSSARASPTTRRARAHRRSRLW